MSVRVLSRLRFVRFFGHLRPVVVREIFDRALSQRLPGLASEMAFNAMLALFPAILAVMTAISLVSSSRATFEELAQRLGEVAPGEVLFLIEGFVREISRGHNEGLFSFSFLFSLWAASGVLSAAMNALDQIHQIPPAQARPFWKARLVSLALTVGTIGFLLVASLLVFVSDLVVQFLAGQGGVWQQKIVSLWWLLSWPLALGIMATAFAFIYRYGPSRWDKGTPIMPGAMLAAVFWAILSWGFRFYVAHSGHYNRVYGAIGAVIVLLLWLDLTALVMLLGDQLNFTVGQDMLRSRRIKGYGLLRP